MSKKNERYYKVHEEAGQQRRYPIDKNKLDAIDSRFIVQFEGLQGQEVTMKEKKTKTIPVKNVKTLKASKQHQFPVLKKVTRKEKLANIKFRLLLLKYAYKWQRKTFGKISPSKARQHYQQKLLKSSLKQWEDFWWNGKNEWKLNIRADYHNRFRLWLKVWRGWRSFVLLKRIKKTKINVAEKKADQVLLKKCLANWKNYIGERERKKQFYLQAEEEGKIVIKRMAFLKWKNCLKFKQEVHLMEKQALHFWARRLFYKAWQCWLYKYSSALEEKHKIHYAVQLYNRKLAYKTLQSFKLYGMRRNLKKLRLASAIRFHRLIKVRDTFLKWKILLERKRELMQFEDDVLCKGNEARKRRVFTHWKHYIILCQCKRHSDCRALDHFETNLKIKCLRALKGRVELQRRTAAFHVTATKFYKISLQRRIWMVWLRGCEEREDFRQITLINFVRNHHRKFLLRKMIHRWKCYCEGRRLKQNQKLKADITARRNMLPRFFSRWETFVELVKIRRINQGRAEEFRRECLLAKTFYRWLQEYHLILDVQMLYRMAIISYNEKLKTEFFQEWLTKTRQRLKENRLLERGGDHYRIQLKKKCFQTWRQYIKHLNYGSLQLNMAVHHQNKKLLSICWKCWRTFVLKKRGKWKLTIKADLHFRHRILKKLVGIWKLYCNNVKEIKSFAEEKKACYDKKTLRFLFNCWRGNAQCLKRTRENYRTSSQHWQNKTMKRVFLTWRVYAEKRSWEKHKELCSIFEARRQLDQGKLHRVLNVWKKQYLLKISSNEKSAKATEHWKRCVLQNAFDALKKRRFLSYRKQVLHQHCMLYHNDRITASHWRIWRVKYAERITFVRKSRMALWMWSFTLQRKAFVSWFQYVEEKKRKRAAINKALERRQQWLHKVAVTHWIEFATYFIAERERFAALRHIQLSQNVQRNVQKYALHWRRKTERNRGEVRPGTKQPSFKSSREVMSTESKSSSKTHQPSVVRNTSRITIRRPQPRVPEYLRESFNLSELSDPIDTEAVPRNLPSNFQPIIQPHNLPEPTSCTISTTSRSSSGGSQTGSKEMTCINNSVRNHQSFSKKSSSGKKHVLLPPSSFVQTKKSLYTVEARRKQADKRQESKKMDGRAHLHVPEDSSERDSSASFEDDLDSVAISRFLSDKQSQQSIVELRNRMSKYYTVSTQLRNSRRKLSCLRQWLRDSMANNEMLDPDEKSLIEEIIDELSEKVESTNYDLEESYKTISDDLQQLLDKVS